MTSRLSTAGGHLYVHPTNPDILYTMGTSVYRSVDGGRTVEAIKGAPGGDDPHSMWIDPTNPNRMFMGADQGPAITLDAGKTWTPWYTMFNGEFYFVSTDQQFPYRIYAAQQDSGTVSILSRSDFGAIRPNDWYPISGYEQGHIFADPLDPRCVRMGVCKATLLTARPERQINCKSQDVNRVRLESEARERRLLRRALRRR